MMVGKSNLSIAIGFIWSKLKFLISCLGGYFDFAFMGLLMM